MKKHILTLLIIGLVSISLSAQGKISLGISGGLASPAGDFGDIYSSGFGGAVNVYYPLSNSFTLYGSVGYYNWQFSEDYFNDFLDDLGVSDKPTVDAPISNIPVVAGIQYAFSSGKFKPYVSFELGLHLVSVTAESVKWAGVDYPIQEEQSESVAGYGIGAGFTYSISKSLELDINANFKGNGLEFAQSKNSYEDGVSIEESTSSSMTYTTIFAGLRFAL